MRKLLVGIMALLPLLWACDSDSEQLTKQVKSEIGSNVLTRTTSSGLGVDNLIIFLRSDGGQQAGELAITANVPEISLKWSMLDSCNLDTTLTHLKIVDGRATLNIKWDKELENGNYIPEALAFDNGVLLSDGTSSIYVHLILTQEPYMPEFNYLLENPGVEMSPTFIKISPREGIMTEKEGVVAHVTMKGCTPAMVEAHKIGSFTNINVGLIPEIIEEDMAEIPFQWKSSAPNTSFKFDYFVYSYETALRAKALVSYKVYEEPFITITPTDLMFYELTSTQVVKVNTNSEIWEVQNYESIPDWISLSQKKGSKGVSTFNITVTSNQSKESRSFKLTLVSGGVTADLNILQHGLR